MVSLFEVSLKEDKLFYIELSKIFGIGLNLSKKLCSIAGIGLYTRVLKVTTKQLDIITYYLKTGYIINSELRTLKMQYLQQQFDIRCYKAYRKINGLPANGQRTKTNAKTAKKLNKQYFYK